MYLTAQKVISSDNQTGINAFLHLHVNGSFPNHPLDEKAVIMVTEERTGILIAELIELTPGGNRVTCYLDVVASDSTDPTDIFRALDQFERMLPTDILPIVKVIGNVGIRLNADISLWDNISQEFKALRDHIAKVFGELPTAG